HSPAKNDAELSAEKRKDYRNVVVLQIIIVTFGLTLSEFVFDGAKTPAAKLVITVFLSFAGLYGYPLWDLLRNFTQNKVVLRVFLLLLVGSIGTGMLGEFPSYEIIHFPDRQLYRFAVHGRLC